MSDVRVGVALTSIPVQETRGSGGPLATNQELREDGSLELREDGTVELRE